MNRWIDWIKTWLGIGQAEARGRPPVKQSRHYVRRLLVLALCGILLLVFSRVVAPAAAPQKQNEAAFNQKDAKVLSDVKSKISSSSSAEYDENYVGQNLKNILDQMDGVSDVSVMITFSSTVKNIYQNNIKTQDNETVEKDEKGGTRRINARDQDSEVVMVDKNGIKEPVVIGKEQPSVRGVIVAARGAEQPATRAAIMEAVATVLDIPEYKVKVLQKSE
ncbi:MAG: stage III sporulation protein AG [Sporolactobacillus sp.]